MHAPGPRRVVPKSQYGGGVQVLTEDTIGLPIYYPDGPYKGKTILTLIEEVQKPDLGRNDVFMPGLICYAELFPYNADFEYDPRIYPDGRPPPTPIQPTGAPGTRIHLGAVFLIG
ncbi:hypothetical protein EXIGLDRAFT_379312 [Exidia glandulosa HHB12029]|uniref:Uncharacterized protein n=1 Tax=Exidia glandulosa HHB12029 TaxID=1314781 RepID=A0A165L5I8_EXIGL|nr:hypothetical protein EXIGLDRAFT_379312 [Exidia glandulosa HHB12029]